MASTLKKELEGECDGYMMAVIESDGDLGCRFREAAEVCSKYAFVSEDPDEKYVAGFNEKFHVTLSSSVSSKTLREVAGSEFRNSAIDLVARDLLDSMGKAPADGDDATLLTYYDLVALLGQHFEVEVTDAIHNFGNDRYACVVVEVVPTDSTKKLIASILRSLPSRMFYMPPTYHFTVGYVRSDAFDETKDVFSRVLSPFVGKAVRLESMHFTVNGDPAL